MRRIAAVTLVVVTAVAIGLWLVRDQPRRMVQSALAERLEAEVTVGSLHFDGLSVVRLRRVVIRIPAAPGLREVRIAEIVARGGLGEMAAGRFQSLRLTGVEVVVEPAAGTVWPSTLGTAARLVVARLDAAGHLTLRSSGGDSIVRFTSELNDLGGAPHGTIRFTSDQLQLEPLLRLGGLSAADGLPRIHAEGLVGELRAGAQEPRFALTARADRIVVAGRPDLSAALLEGTVVEEAPGVFQVELLPSLPSVGEARLEATLGSSPWRVTRLRALARDLDAAAWSLPPLDLPSGWSVVGGMVDVEVGGEPARGLTVAVSAHDLDIAGAIAVRANLAGTGVLQIAGGGALGGRLELTGRLARPPAATAPDVMLDAVLPATLTGSIAVAAINRPLAATLRLDTAAAGSLDLTGTAGLAAPLALDARWSWSGGDIGELLQRLAPQAAAAVPGGLVVAGEVSARGRLGGDVAALTVSGELEIRGLTVRSPAPAGGGPPGWQLSGEHPAARFAWTRAAPTIELEVPDTRMIVTVDPLAPVSIAVQAAAVVDIARASIRFRQVVCDAGRLGTARLEGDWQPAAAASVRLAVGVDDPGSWLQLAAPFLGDPLRAATASGRVTLDFAATRDDTGWHFGGPIKVAGAGLSAAGGSRVMEGLEADGLLRGTAGPDDVVTANLAATLGGFQVLWGAHYADFSDRQAVVDIDASRDSGHDTAVTVRLDLPPQATVAGTLRSAAGAAPVWEGSLTVADIGGFWERYVAVPFQGTLGAVGDLRVAGGELRTQLRGMTDDTTTVTGEVALDALSVASAEGGMSVDSLQLRLPVDLGWTADGTVVAGEPHRGSLGFDRAAVAGVRLAATSTELRTLGDAVTLVGGLHLPVFGGEVVLEDVALAELARSSRHLTAAVGLLRISLTKVARALGLPPLEGDVAGRFPRVRFSHGILVVDGTGELSLFGGTVTMRDIAGSELLTRYPHLKLSADWQGIDLAQLTRTFDFGAMSGIVEGHIDDCEIFRDVPTGFRGVLRSAPRKGVPQRISLKAVNNIAIVGTGSGLGFLDGGLRRFISSYAYHAIGIEMTLSNDHFLLRGLERRGDRELFVKGRFPLRLDVVNAEPGMTVSFRTMLQRLRTLDVTTVTTQP